MRPKITVLGTKEQEIGVEILKLDGLEFGVSAEVCNGL
jgi:hypothetical protein